MGDISIQGITAQVGTAPPSDANITFTDVTTNNASTTKHGFLKKLDNSATNFMNGQGNWATAGVNISGNALFFPMMETSVIQGTWSWSIDVLHYAGVRGDGGGSQNDEISFSVPLSAGTYTVKMMAMETTDRGIVTVTIDGVSAGTMDYYAAGTTRNVIKSITGISVSTSGIKAVNIKMATKNASSSNYGLYWNWMKITRTA